MKNNYENNYKGHGYFRKAKAFGLVSGILIGTSLIFGTQVASADETAATTNTNIQNEAATATNNSNQNESVSANSTDTATTNSSQNETVSANSTATTTYPLVDKDIDKKIKNGDSYYSPTLILEDNVTYYVPNVNDTRGNVTFTDNGIAPRVDSEGNIVSVGKPRVISIGTEYRAEVKDIDFEERIIENPFKPVGYRNVLIEGKKGKHYRVYYGFFDATSRQYLPQIAGSTLFPEHQYVEVGTGERVSENVKTVYEGRVTSEALFTRIVTPSNKDKPATIIVGLKPVIFKRTYPAMVEVIENPLIKSSQSKRLRDPKDGEEITTFTYTMDPETGKVSRSEKTTGSKEYVNSLFENGVYDRIKHPKFKPLATSYITADTYKNGKIAENLVTPEKPVTPEKQTEANKVLNTNTYRASGVITTNDINHSEKTLPKTGTTTNIVLPMLGLLVLGGVGFLSKKEEK